jgi:tripartite ATP-independent transporter DctM subunit
LSQNAQLSPSQVSLPDPTASQVGGLNPRTFWTLLDLLVKVVLATALLGQLGVVFANIMTRQLFGFSLQWVQEVSELGLAVLTFIGGARAYSKGQHLALRAFTDRIPVQCRGFQGALVDWLVFGIAVVGCAFSIPLLQQATSQVSIVLGISGVWAMLPLTAGLALLALYALRLLWNRNWRDSGLAGILVMGLTVLSIATSEVWQPVIGSHMLLVTMVLFALMAGIGVPIGFVLAIAAVVYLFGSGQAPLTAVPLAMLSGVTNFVLLTVPFFVMAGLIMDKGGVGLRVVDMVQAYVGHFRGGLLHVMIISMYVVSGISGSKVADMAAVGSVMSGAIRRKGYPPGEGVAVLAASAAMGETVPPSIVLLIVGSITSLSVVALFLAGILPAAVIAAGMMAMAYFRARRFGWPHEQRAPLRHVLRATTRGIPAAVMPVILIAGILTGFATPTEVSTFAVLYGLVLGFVLYRELNFRTFTNVVTETSTMVGMMLFILATASAFTWAVTVERLPQTIADAMIALPGGPIIFILVSVLVLIAMGSLLEGLPALLIFAPILLPAAEVLGINPLHYGIILIIAMGFGAFAPPLGVGYYVACAIGGTAIEEAIWPTLSYKLVSGLGILLICFFPIITLILPQAFGLGH